MWVCSVVDDDDIQTRDEGNNKINKDIDEDITVYKRDMVSTVPL